MAKERVYPSDGDKWAAELVERIGSAMKRARAGGKSAAWLSARTEEIGYRISPTVVSKLDSGHRGGVLSVPELLVIAAALEIPALDLLYSDHDQQVCVLPGVNASTKVARNLFTGHDLERLERIDAEVQQANDMLREAIEEHRQAVEGQQQANNNMREALAARRQAVEEFRQAAEELQAAIEIRQQAIEMQRTPRGDDTAGDA
ncbi:hypothetical protein [Mycobacterium sp. SMC-19]|uniref:hypothetical protein n=1 Tax=Mycobacterium sp. SMC-19 TaxID=3381630 RepID=UPI003876BCA2